MDEPPVSRERSEQDADAPLTREDPDWFAHVLGEDWQPEERGIYRFVGATRPTGGLENQFDRDGDEPPETHEPGRRWAPWRRN